MSRFKLALMTPFYVAGQGMALGFILGLLTGTMIIPVFGSLFGAIWGLGMGAVAGAIIGVAYAILLLTMQIEGVIRSQKWLRFLGVTVTVSIVTYAFLRITDDVATSTFRLSIFEYLLLAAFSLIGAITSAAGTDSWLDWLRQHSLRKLKHQPPIARSQGKIGSILYDMLRFTFARGRWFRYLAPIAVVAAVLVHIIRYPPTDLLGTLGSTLIAILASLLYVGVQTAFIASWVTFIIMAANRYLFTADTDPRIYKRNLSILTFCLVLPSQLVVAAFIGAPIAAIIATLAVRDYADWVHSPEKQKTKPKAPAQVTTNDVLKEAFKP